ncbi:MAG: division/cell wall cluster transcriptional repressor MraZ [Anaerolineae bacterium]
MSFLGTYTHTLDSKGRLTIPARLREGLDEGLILARGFERCLVIYPQSVWEEQTRRLSAMPRTSRERRVFTRWVYGGATEVTLDGLGRILIPDHLREYAALQEQAKIVGSNEAIEIWSPELHETSLSDDLESLPEILDRMSEKGSI